MSQNAHLSTPDPEWVAALGGKPLPSFAPEGALTGGPVDWKAHRAGGWTFVESMLKAAPNQVPASALRTIDLTIPVGDGAEIPAEAYIPEPNAELGEQPGHRFPLLYWLHGGGWSLGDHRSDRLTFQNLAIKGRVSVISVGYRLAPEFPFPTGVNDCFAALRWSGDNSETLGADVSKGFIVGGMSAGSNLSAVIAHMARDDSSFKYKITGQLHQIPALIDPTTAPEGLVSELYSHTQNKETDPVLTPSYVKLLLQNYKADPSDTRMSPLLLSSFKDLPPAYMQVAGGDLLRDDAYAYQRRLTEAGVPSKIDIYPGVPHGWFIFHPKISSSVKFYEDTYVGLKWLLNGAQ